MWHDAHFSVRRTRSFVSNMPAGTAGRYAVLVSPLLILHGFVSWMFDKPQPKAAKELLEDGGARP